MNRNNKTSSITESAMITGILVIIAYISSFISITMFFYPTPAIILAKRRGLKYAALSLIAADIIISILLGITTGAIYLILYTPFALALAYGAYGDKDANKTILYGSAAYMISFVVLLFLMNTLMGFNFVEDIRNIYNESFTMIEEMVANSPTGMNSENIEETLSNLKEYREASDFLIVNLFPAMIILGAMFASYINYVIAGSFARRFSIIIKKHEGLAQFSFPKTFIMAMAALLLISYLLSVLNFNVSVIQLNLFYIIFMAMLLQGFAVIKYFLDKRKTAKSFQILIIFMIFYMSFVAAGVINIIAVLGIVDLAINLRNISKAV